VSGQISIEKVENDININGVKGVWSFGALILSLDPTFFDLFGRKSQNALCGAF
jgi:hypothetical protein